MDRDERGRDPNTDVTGGGGAEPFLGYDGLPTDDLLGWIEEADPETDQLRAMFDYEEGHRAREAVLHELKERLRRSGLRPAQD